MFRLDGRNDPETYKRRQMEIQLRLAEAALEASTISLEDVNQKLYVALSHLAAVEELNIKLASYADYEYSNNLPFNPDLCATVNDKIQILKALIACGDDKQ